MFVEALGIAVGIGLFFLGIKTMVKAGSGLVISLKNYDEFEVGQSVLLACLAQCLLLAGIGFVFLSVYVILS